MNTYNNIIFDNKTTASERIQEDNILQKFRVHSLSDDVESGMFQCVPNETSNLDVFKFCNPKVSHDEANEIFRYYREQFIKAQLMNKELSFFRKKIHEFITEKPVPTSSLTDYSEIGILLGDVHNKSTYENPRRSIGITDFIGVACYLELMYRIDKLTEEINNGMTVDEQAKLSKRICGTVPFNNYRSYFSTGNSMPFDPKDYETRKLVLKHRFDYAFKQKHTFICESEVGCVHLVANIQHNPFIIEFIKKLKEGVEINVVKSEQKLSIDDEQGHIYIDRFFLD